jgi:hydrogenase nickel incorporation protein HypA/HybF
VHEFGITQSILEMALEEATAANATRITQFNLVLSAASHIAEDAVQKYFKALSKGSMAEGAVLEFKREPAEFRCWSCEYNFWSDVPHPVCPRCQEIAHVFSMEEEFYLESIDVE